MTKRALYIREAPQYETSGWTADDQFALSFSGMRDGLQMVILLKADDKEQYYREAIKRTQGDHTPVIEVNKSIGEIVRNKKVYLSH